MGVFDPDPLTVERETSLKTTGPFRVKVRIISVVLLETHIQSFYTYRSNHAVVRCSFAVNLWLGASVCYFPRVEVVLLRKSG